MKKIELTEETRCLAYLDVLGFKEVLRSGKEKVSAYYNALEVARKSATFDVDSAILGDAIILSKPMKEQGDLPGNLAVIAEMLQAIGAIQWVLALSDIWIRGAVCIGSTFSKDKEFLTGSALARAAELEKTVAKFPRVILDNDIVNSPYLAFGKISVGLEGSSFKNPGQLIEEINILSLNGHWRSRILFDWKDVDPANLRLPRVTPYLTKDVPFFVDYLSPLRRLEMQHQKAIIIENLERRSCSDIQHYSKYRWVCDYLTAVLQGNDLIHRDAMAALANY